MIEKIYHYTDITTLGLILKNKTIRFKRFDSMDDRTETDGLPEMLKKNYFLSCWVLDMKEKIPQWAMYAPQGVRIEMPIRWYKKFLIPIEGTNQYIDKIPLEDNHPAKKMFFPRPFSDWFQQGKKYYFVPPMDDVDGFMVKVKYHENFTELKKQNWKENYQGNGIDLLNQAAPIKYKDAYWSFQDEIRFYLYAGCKHEDRHDMPEYIDLPIDENALKEIKIRLYPNCSKENWQQVKDLISDNFATLDANEIMECSLLDGKYYPKTLDVEDLNP
ncbi:hypothetical protein [Kaistella sp.]|uniref:hypothetical protein n=1 Tax=Kaistella sp. TaxID=2782235 RepID=UPI003C35CC99